MWCLAVFRGSAGKGTRARAQECRQISNMKTSKWAQAMQPVNGDSSNGKRGKYAKCRARARHFNIRRAVGIWILEPGRKSNQARISYNNEWRLWREREGVREILCISSMMYASLFSRLFLLGSLSAWISGTPAEYIDGGIRVIKLSQLPPNALLHLRVLWMFFAAREIGCVQCKNVESGFQTYGLFSHSLRARTACRVYSVPWKMVRLCCRMKMDFVFAVHIHSFIVFILRKLIPVNDSNLNAKRSNSNKRQCKWQPFLNSWCRRFAGFPFSDSHHSHVQQAMTDNRRRHFRQRMATDISNGQADQSSSAPIENIEWREINKFIWSSQNCESLSVEVERSFATQFDAIHFDSLVVRILPSANGLFSFISLRSPPYSFRADLSYIVSHHIGCCVRPHVFFFFVRSFASRRRRRCCSNHFDSICSPRRFTRNIVFILLISLVDGTQSGFYCIFHIGILIRISSTT